MPKHVKKSRRRKERSISFWIPADVQEKHRIETNGYSVWDAYLPILDPEEPMEIDEPSSYHHEVQREQLQASQWIKKQNEALNQTYLSKHANLSIQGNHQNNAYIQQTLYDMCEKAKNNLDCENLDDDYADYKSEDEELMLEWRDQCQKMEMQKVDHTDVRSCLELIAFIHWAASDHRVIAAFQILSSENNLRISIFRKWIEFNPLQMSACIQWMIRLPKQYIQYQIWVKSRQRSDGYHVPLFNDNQLPEMYRKNELRTTGPVFLAYFIHWAIGNSEVMAGFYNWLKDSSDRMSLFENWIISNPPQMDACQTLAAKIQDQNVQYQQWFGDKGSCFVNEYSMQQVD